MIRKAIVKTAAPLATTAAKRDSTAMGNQKWCAVVGIHDDGSEEVLQQFVAADNAAGYCATFNRLSLSVRAEVREIDMASIRYVGQSGVKHDERTVVLPPTHGFAVVNIFENGCHQMDSLINADEGEWDATGNAESYAVHVSKKTQVDSFGETYRVRIMEIESLRLTGREIAGRKK